MARSCSKLLFFDHRDLLCGSLAWLAADGRRLGVADPAGQPEPLRAEPQRVPWGVRLAAQPATTSGPVESWKGWGRTIRDGGRYRAWHLEVNGHTQLGTGAPAHEQPPEDVFVCAVESDDGYVWRQTCRSRIDVRGQRGFDGLTSFVDPVAPPAERYKLLWCAAFEPGMHCEMVAEYLRRPERDRDARMSGERPRGMFLATSPDGLGWVARPEPFMLHVSDTDTTVEWDPDIGRYVMYTRMFRQDRRWVGRAEAEELHRWGPVKPLLRPRLDDPPDQDYYLNGYSRVPGSPEYRLMLPMVYSRATERSEVRLYSSADGEAWDRVPGCPVLQPGPSGSWDCEYIGGGKDLVPFGPDRIAVPYSGTCYPHKYPRWGAVWRAWRLGWAAWPRDRLCALAAEQEGGFWTTPVVPAGRSLRLNLRTPMAGMVRVGLEGVEGRGLEDCDPIAGDLKDRIVSWRGQSDIGVPEGRPVALRFQLRCAELFSVSFV